MSKFYVSAQGARGEVTRTGTHASGVTAHVRSWTRGVRAEMGADGFGHDIATIEITEGSSPGGRRSVIELQSFTLDRILDGTLRLTVVPVEWKGEIT